MNDSNSVIIRKTYDDFAKGNILRYLQSSTRASRGTFPVMARYQATMPATIRSEASFNADGAFRRRV